MASDPDDDAVLERVDELLGAGPLPLAELAELLAADGYLGESPADDLDDLIDELDDLLYRYEGFWTTADGMVATMAALLADTVFTHRVTAAELDDELLTMVPDLTAVTVDRSAPLPLVSGGAIDVVVPEFDGRGDDSGSLTGPPGWLSGFAPGDLVVITRVGDGATVARIDGTDETDDPDETDAEVRALGFAFAARVSEPLTGESLVVVLLDVLAASSRAFRRPLPPLGELLSAAGLESRGDWVGPVGTDWKPPAMAAADAERVVLAERYQLDVCCLELLDGVMDSWNELVVPSGVEPHDWRDIARALQHGFVAPAFADHILSRVDDGHPLLDTFIAALESAGARATAPAAYLTARNLERRGDVLAAETALRAAVRASPEFEPAVEELSWYVADRGDVDQAVNLLRRSGAPVDDPELLLLESMRPQRNAVGRNEPCPCGSGRKYKDCCARNQSMLPIEQRSDWLLHKLWTFILRPDRQHLALSLAMVMALDDDDAFDQLLDIGLPMDLAAFEGGLAAEFLRQRGVLLPADERALLASWVDLRRELWEVAAIDAGTVSLRNKADGHVVQLRATGQLDRGQGALVLARIGQAGSQLRFVGVPIDIPDALADSAEDLVASNPTATDVARWFADALDGV